VRRPDARSAQIGTSDRIPQVFQVSAYSGEPAPSVSARNLLAKDLCRAALADEPSHLRPEVSFVRFALPLAGAA